MTGQGLYLQCIAGFSQVDPYPGFFHLILDLYPCLHPPLDQFHQVILFYFFCYLDGICVRYTASLLDLLQFIIFPFILSHVLLCEYSDRLL